MSAPDQMHAVDVIRPHLDPALGADTTHPSVTTPTMSMRPPTMIEATRFGSPCTRATTPNAVTRTAKMP